MYSINLPDVARYDLSTADVFVEFWSQFYGYEVKLLNAEQQIDYFSELNVGGDLTEENVCRLLRWKDPRHLTHIVLSGPKAGAANSTVAKILDRLDLINRFRRDQLTEDAIRLTAAEVFDSGMVWRAFLVHIAKPHIYPIADQNVFRAWSLHTQSRDEQTWETYDAYRRYFNGIAETLRVARTIENLRRLKQIDNALFAFGQFLKAYYRNPEAPR